VCKCAFCDWSTSAWVTTKKGKRINCYRRLQLHVDRAHPEEAKKIKQWAQAMCKIIILLLMLAPLDLAVAEEEPILNGAASVVSSDIAVGNPILCRFGINGEYERGAEFRNHACMDYKAAVLKLRPFSWFCWWSDPCSGEKP